MIFLRYFIIYSPLDDQKKMYTSNAIGAHCKGEIVGGKLFAVCGLVTVTIRIIRSPLQDTLPRRFQVIDVWIKGVSLSVRKGDQGDASLDMNLLSVGLNIPSSLRPYLCTSHLRYQQEFVLHLFLTLFFSLVLAFHLSIWYRRLLAARKGSRARGKLAVKLKHDEGSRLRCEEERDGEGVKRRNGEEEAMMKTETVLTPGTHP